MVQGLMQLLWLVVLWYGSMEYWSLVIPTWLAFGDYDSPRVGVWSL